MPLSGHYCPLLDGPLGVNASERPSDDMVTALVQDALRKDLRVVVMDITVKTLDGIVTLTGSVSVDERNAVIV